MRKQELIYLDILVQFKNNGAISKINIILLIPITDFHLTYPIVWLPKLHYWHFLRYSFRASFFIVPAFVQFTNIKKISVSTMTLIRQKGIYERNEFTSLGFRLNNSEYVLKEKNNISHLKTCALVLVSLSIQCICFNKYQQEIFSSNLVVIICLCFWGNIVKLCNKNTCLVLFVMKSKKPEEIQFLVRIESPGINIMMRSSASITRELSSSKHIWTIDPCSHI